MLFINISATHAPTVDYVSGPRQNRARHKPRRWPIDRCLPPLFTALQQRSRAGVAYLMSDHGTLFGEDGWFGHRVSHPLVWNVPYAEYRWE